MATRTPYVRKRSVRYKPSRPDQYNGEAVPFSLGNKEESIDKLNRDIEGLHHAFNREQIDYILEYCQASVSDNPKFKYAIKFLGKLIFISLFTGLVLILPYILTLEFNLNLKIPIGIFFTFVFLSQLDALLTWLRMPTVIRRKEKKKVKQGKILRPDEVDKLAAKRERGLEGLYRYCEKNKENWDTCKAELAELYAIMGQYCSEPIRKIESFDLLYYRLLKLFDSVYTTILLIISSLMYAYILFFDALPVEQPRDIAEVLLVAFVITSLICCLKLLAFPYTVESFKKQVTYFVGFHEKTKIYINTLDKRYQRN
ncbi:MAG: hypothetical protein D3923_03575 [Candidatus Electrothrix sp. AR3]|nr:hypothetical protein [Candidatus Electrothrix sp. AR3]